MSATAATAEGGFSASKQDSLFSPRYLAITLGLASSVLLTAFEGLAVFTALPVAVAAVHGTAYLSLCFTAFTTASLVGMVVSGVRADRAGPALPFLGGTAVFGIGLLVAGTADAMAQLVAGRALQGFGAGLVMVSLYVIIGRGYPERLRASALAMMAALWVMPSVIGPLVAGILTEDVSWRWVFLGVALLVPLPVALTAGPLRGMRAGPAASGPDSRAAAGSGPWRRVQLAVIAAVGAGALQYAGQDFTVVGIVLALGGIALLVPSVPKLLPRGTLRVGRGLPAVIVMHGVIGAAFFGSENYITTMLETDRGLSPTIAGLTLVGETVSWAAAAQLASRGRLPFSRETMVRIGPLVTIASIVVTGSAVVLPAPAVIVAVGMVIGGLGMSLVFQTLNLLLLRYSPKESQGTNSSAMQICDSLAAVVLTGGTGAVFHALHHAGPTNHGMYILIFAILAAAAGATALIAPRVGAHGLATA
ncbi:MFS transporter [Catenulispora sp. NF23]|uniref:MFS transporter n=1 Tax=Catenulispora pinistramenti TaxID=2705254 RepID=UPI001BA6BFE6|nr:MFS transporter [Catenulispora pinistramenti]MBS2537324.1 MFS transporter [Catenulispora pinistramenti]